MNKNKIITELYNSKFIDEMLLNITLGSDLRFDLKQELFLILLEMDKSKIIDAYENNYINYLCINILTKQYRSKNSEFHRKYKRDIPIESVEVADNGSDYDESIDELTIDIMKFVDEECNLTDKELFKMYFKFGRYDRYIGELRDKNCDKPISSSRKIGKKLELKGVPGSNKISITHTSVANSVRDTINKIRIKYGCNI